MATKYQTLIPNTYNPTNLFLTTGESPSIPMHRIQIFLDGLILHHGFGIWCKTLLPCDQGPSSITYQHATLEPATKKQAPMQLLKLCCMQPTWGIPGLHHLLCSGGIHAPRLTRPVTIVSSSRDRALNDQLLLIS